MVDRSKAAVPLTPRQRSVLGLLAHGRTTSDIALVLGLSESTIKWHCGRLLRRYGVGRRSAVVVLAIAAGELDPNASLETAVKGAVHHRPRQGSG
jgi:DNA-binding CsgD family transcriptional regulator